MATQEEIDEAIEFARDNSADKHRRENHDRLGVGHPDPSLIVLPGTGIVSPVTVAQGLGVATLIWSFETLSATADYSVSGTALATSGTTVIFQAAGPFIVVSGTALVNTDVSDPTIPGGGIANSGVHTYACFIDPPNNLLVTFLDGVQIGLDDSGVIDDWSDAIGTWTYLNVTTDIGTIGELHIFPGFRPAITVG